MKIVQPKISIDGRIAAKRIMKKLERIGRVAYQSKHKITDDSYGKFLRMIIDNKHDAVLEHESITVLVTCDCGVAREWVRHRIGSYLHESTRYCNYMKDRFGNAITVIHPNFWNDKPHLMKIWKTAMKQAEDAYFKLLKNGATIQEARTVLPFSLKGDLYVTFNLRQWRHFLRLRTAKNAHPQMIEVANMTLIKLKEKLPILFEDFEVIT